MVDVNVLVHAFRRDSPHYEPCAAWLHKVVNGDEAYAVADPVLSGFLRIVTHPRIFRVPSSMEEALEFVGQLRSRPQCVVVSPGARHWEIFTRLCREAGVRGNRVPDAYLAALAIESGSEWITMDRDYARFPGLRWRVPW